MILLFDSKASKSTASAKSSKVRNNPVENSGILAMNMNDAKSLLTMGEYDTYVSSNPVAVDYAMYSNFSDFSDFSNSDSGFMSEFSDAVATLTDGGFGAFGGFSAGADCGASCSSGSFASVC